MRIHCAAPESDFENHSSYVVSISSLAVAKALRRAAEGKASAQAEAAEWKRKFELERARNLQLELKGF